MVGKHWAMVMVYCWPICFVPKCWGYKGLGFILSSLIGDSQLITTLSIT